jgi:hypothetical protein
MKTVLASLIASLFALAALSAHAAPAATGMSAYAGPTTLSNDEDKDKDKDGGKKSD